MIVTALISSGCSRSSLKQSGFKSDVLSLSHTSHVHKVLCAYMSTNDVRMVCAAGLHDQTRRYTTLLVVRIPSQIIALLTSRETPVSADDLLKAFISGGSMTDRDHWGYFHSASGVLVVAASDETVNFYLLNIRSGLAGIMGATE